MVFKPSQKISEAPILEKSSAKVPSKVSEAPISVAFVHDFLDAYGLDPYEFRVYCHIVRRTGGKPDKQCFSSLSNIADMCQMSQRKTQQIVQFLLKARMITKEAKKHPKYKTDIYHVTLASEWVPKSQLNELRVNKLRSRSKKQVLGEDSGQSDFSPLEF
ncbi:MAG: replication protein [Acaryochloris sp. RU_4_1]|nr:replication protein [Acaryochloris sp. RU_4_1]